LFDDCSYIWSIGLAGSVLAGAALAGEPGDISTFTEEAVSRGLVYEIQSTSELTSSVHGFGIAIADLNGNGHNDLVLLGHSEGIVGFFENDGNGFFTDRSYTEVDGKPVPKFVYPMASGIAVADFTGNGLVDIYITQVNDGITPGRNVLLRNEGDFEFTDVSAAADVDNNSRGHAAVWVDFDNSGWLDLYVVNYTYPSVQDDSEHRNKLYRNLGNGTFEDISAGSGVDDHGMGLAAVFSDINRNGWLDLYVVNDRGHSPPMYRANQSWRNDGGQFQNTCETSGLCLGLFSMGVATGDITGNGFVDFYVTNLPHPSAYNGWNPLLINQGDWTFTEECQDAGVCQLILSWASIFFDYNNNGWLDLYVCNQTQANRLYANTGQFPFVNITSETGVAGSEGHSYNAAVGDLTGNGALDLVLNNYGTGGEPANVQLFVNHEGTKRNWVRFNVVGYAPNHHAIGSNVEITADGHTQWREIYAGGNNFKSQNELVYHFGLDQVSVVDQIVVNWPGGNVTRTLTNYPANHTWTIYPPEMLGDANGDGLINVTDLLALFSAWGPVQPGTEIMDINGDGIINVTDLLALFNKWMSG
jgi:enediyne biosynthesis protein E4